jgi:hypothetical protein
VISILFDEAYGELLRVSDIEDDPEKDTCMSLCGQLPHWQDIPGASKHIQIDLHKAFDAIGELRRLAYEHTHFSEMQEYYWAMLMETLFSVLRNYADWKDQATAKLAYQRAQLAAALLCERLAHWGHPWPPEHLLLEPQSSTDREQVNVSGIRKLIRAALNAEELTTLCYDHFPPVYQEFSGGLTFDRKITLLLDHCQHHDRLSQLLEYLRAANREKFEQYESQIYLDKRGS